MVTQSKLSDVLNNLERQEQATQTEQTPTTVTEASAEAAATTESPVETTPTESSAQVETTTQEQNASNFSIPIDDESAVTTTNDQSAAPQYNWKDEIKKIDRKELLKEVGLNDFALEVDEYLAKGGNAIDYLNAKAVDYNKISDEDIVKSDLAKQYPTFTAQQIDLMFKRKYNVSEDAEDEDKEFVALQLKADAHNSRQVKIQEQKKFKIPETPILQKDEAYEQWKQERDSQPQLLEQFRNYYENHAATKALNESKRVAINLGEGVAPFNFNIDNPQMLTKALTDGGKILNKAMTTQSGEPDVAKQHLVALFSFDPNRFIMDIFRYGQSMGVRKELVEEGQNAQRPQAIVTSMPGAPSYGVGKFGDKAR